MGVKFKDYYEILGVDRSASAEDIQRAFRAKARKAHPDVDKQPGAEQRFKELNEAYEVLKDPEKRKRYDQLGANWKAGQEFRPPPGWQSAPFDFEFDTGHVDDLGGFSDFFSALFGGGHPFRRAGPRAAPQRRGRDHRVEIALDLEELARGGVKPIQLATQEPDESGRVVTRTKSYDVKLPRGLTEGSHIRLAGQGEPGLGGGPPGDLHLVVRVRPHPRFALRGQDLHTVCVVTPWEAVLGGSVPLPTLTGTVSLKIPAGSRAGQVLRLRGQGLPRDDGTHGDLLAAIEIAVPEHPTAEERELFGKLARASSFQPAERSRKP